MTIATLVGYTLKALVPDVKKIYRSQQMDGTIKFPSFFVQELATQTQLKMTDEQIRTSNFDVVYLVDQDVVKDGPTPAAKIDEMRDFMLSNFTWLVDANGKKTHKVLDLSADVQNGDLHFMFKVISRLGQGDDGVPMASFEQNGGFNG